MANSSNIKKFLDCHALVTQGLAMTTGVENFLLSTHSERAEAASELCSRGRPGTSLKLRSATSALTFQIEAVLKGAAKKTALAPVKCAAIGTKGDYLVIVPGLLSCRLSVIKLKAKFKKAGYTALYFQYQWLKYSPSEISGQFLAQFIKTHCTDVKKKINFVAHSTGGLILQQYLQGNKDLRFNRVVMLAPPFGGSEIANWFKNYFSWLGPTWTQLGILVPYENRGSAPRQIELGVIAGTYSFNPLSFFLIKGANDGFVSVEATKLLGMKEYITVPVSHYFLMLNSDVITNIIAFIRAGRFIL